MTGIKSEIRFDSMPRVLMLGPDLSVKGGMTSVIQSYLDAWNQDRYALIHIGTYVDHPNKLIKAWVALKALVRAIYHFIFWRPRIIHIHFSWKASFYRKSVFLFLAKIFGCRTVLHCHASRFDVFYENNPPSIQRWIVRVLNAADRLLVVSKHWQNYFQRLSVRVPTVVLYNPVRLPSQLPEEKFQDPVVLTLGELGHRKGTYDILEAIPNILRLNPTARFWLGGDGDVDRVHERISREAWGERVHLLGWVRGQDKEQRLAQACIFLLPSYHEGLPVAILEAMAYGLPVVATPVGGIPEAIIDGTTGYLVEPGDIDAITEKTASLLQDHDLRSQMGAAARQRAADVFQLEGILLRLYRIYDDLVASSKV